MIRLTLVSNSMHLEAVRRLRRRPELRSVAGEAAFDLLIWEPRRMRLEPGDRRLWPLRLPVSSMVLATLTVLAQMGLVGELRLPHLRKAGRALRMIAARARRLVLIDDGLDQYRDEPRAMDPARFPIGTPYWLFSDAPAARASWCRRFTCLELGPLYRPRTPAPQPQEQGSQGTLVIDAPGLERLEEAKAALLPRPWLVLPHPVREKRAWPLPAAPGDSLATQPPEELIPSFQGLIVVGESMTLLAAVRLRRPGSRLLIALPRGVDANLARLAAELAAREAGVKLLDDRY